MKQNNSKTAAMIHLESIIITDRLIINQSTDELALLYLEMQGRTQTQADVICPLDYNFVRGVCSCVGDWTGPDCSIPTCPNSCHENLNHGKCNFMDSKCDCKPGVIGESCALKLDSSK